MARRSPLNARYQKNTEPKGKTRRSASAARPKREAGGQGSSAPAKRSSAERPSFREALRGGPQMPEMRKWRRVWWVLILSAFAFAMIAGFVPFVQQQPVLRVVVMVAYLVTLGGALYIDLSVIRRLRREAGGEPKKK